MSDDGPDHLAHPPDFVSQADSTDPLRDPVNADEGDPDPFDAAAHGQAAADPLAADEPAPWAVHDPSDGQSSALDDPDPSEGADADDRDDLEGRDHGDLHRGDGSTSLDHPTQDLPDDPHAGDRGDDGHDSESGLDRMSAEIVDALDDLTVHPAAVAGAAPTGWDGAGPTAEPLDTAWAVPEVDPDPDFIDVDLLR